MYTYIYIAYKHDARADHEPFIGGPLDSKTERAHMRLLTLPRNAAQEGREFTKGGLVKGVLTIHT